MAYETYGELNADASNALVVCHALTGDAHASGEGGWWKTMVGKGRPVDTDRFFVVSANLLGGCRGTTGPSSTDPDTGRAYGLRFPLLTVRDLVEVQRALLRNLGIERVHAVIGGSLGGMQALQWAIDHPEEVQRAVLVGASARLNAQNIAVSKVAREAITRDPGFQGGDYPGSGRSPDAGLTVARMLAHITYLSEESLDRKFGRERRGAASEMTFDTDFEVESYLDHQGQVFVDRFDALTYLYLSRVMDYFEPFDEPDVDLDAVTTRFLLLSFSSDWRFSTAQSAHIAEELTDGGVDVRHEEIDSPWGHDSFLLDLPEYHAAVRAFLG